jgi:hypothetical protein
MLHPTNAATNGTGRSVVTSNCYHLPQHRPHMVPSSPQHCSRNDQRGTKQPFLSDDSYPSSIFVSFDNIVSEESTKDIDLQMTRITLSRSESQSSFDSADMEMELLDVFVAPTPRRLHRTTTGPSPSQRRPSLSFSSNRPSDPVARFLLSK